MPLVPSHRTDVGKSVANDLDNTVIVTDQCGILTTNVSVTKFSAPANHLRYPQVLTESTLSTSRPK
jgi:hypothetical protein